MQNENVMIKIENTLLGGWKEKAPPKIDNATRYWSRNMPLSCKNLVSFDGGEVVEAARK